MDVRSRTLAGLSAVAGLTVIENALLRDYTRFGLGGPARIFAESGDEAAFVEALAIAKRSGLPVALIGGGSNLIVSDDGFDGVVLRFSGNRMESDGARVYVESGAVLWDLVDFTVGRGLRGLETMAAIPGWVGAAIYGNAGAYGHSISEVVDTVRFTDGETVREFTNAGCKFRYRESVFKQKKEWILFSANLAMTPADPASLRQVADSIVKIRNEKFPPTMKCAGSIFKNQLLRDLSPSIAEQIPERVVREGKIPSAWFLEQVGAKGTQVGGIHVADYHANLIYNDGSGTSAELCRLVDDLKARVVERFGLVLEEEVQYVGFPDRHLAARTNTIQSF